MTSALLLAGVLDPNCLPRHHTRPREFAYHSHYYHAPPPPACREPWPDPDLRDVKVTELHEPHGDPSVRAEPGVRAPVSVPEPSTLGPFGFGIATLFALRQRSRRQSSAGTVSLFVGVDIRSDRPETRFTSPRSRLSDVMQVRLSGAWCDGAQRRRCGCAVFCLHPGSDIVMEKIGEKAPRP